MSFQMLLYACVLSRVRLLSAPWTVAHQVPLSMESPRQEYFRCQMDDWFISSLWKACIICFLYESYICVVFFFFSLQVKIKEATGLPLNLSNFVFCQYTFWDQCESTVAAPVVDPEVPSPQSKDAQYTVIFSHCKVQMPLQNELLGRLPAGAQFRSLLVTYRFSPLWNIIWLLGFLTSKCTLFFTYSSTVYCNYFPWTIRNRFSRLLFVWNCAHFFWFNT